MRSRFWIMMLGIIAVLSISVSAYKQAYKKPNPCTGDTIWVIDTTIIGTYSPTGGMNEITRVTVLGVTKEWTSTANNYHPTNQEWEDFITGVYNLAAMNCGGSAGGATSLPATAAVATFQQTVFTNLAKPRMAAATVPAAKPQPHAKTAASPAASTVVPPAASTDEEVTLPVANAGAEINPAPAPATTPTETSADKGKAVQLEVAKKEQGTQPLLPPNNITTDIEWNMFAQSGVSGSNYALRAGYNRTLSDEKVTVGGTLIVNTMIMLDKLFFNNAINLSGTYMLTQTSNLERKVGGSVNTFIVDKAFYGTPFGMSIVASFSDNWFVNQDNIVTYGAMFQQSFVGSAKTSLVTGGILFGLPIGDRYAINPNCVMAYNIYTAGKNGSVTVNSPFMLQPAFNGSIYFTKLFSLDLGAKTTLFIKDYSDLILTIGTTILF